MSLTEQQRRAVEAPGSVAVIAGAGTGKTHMLTERYLHHLRGHGLRPLEIVAGTFTEAAAAELRGRVRARLRQLPSFAHYAGELEAAQIGTLHSLAGRICREHPEAAGVPWDFAVQDELQQRLWLERNLRDALLGLPVRLTSALPFDLLTASLRTLLADPFTARSALTASPDAWPQLIEDEKRRACRRMTGLSRWREAVRTLESNVGPQGDKLELQRREVLTAVARLEAGDSSPDACAALGGIDLRSGSAKAWGEAIGTVKEACGALRDLYRGFAWAFQLTLGPADDSLRGLLPLLAESYRLVEAQLSEQKRRERLLDFSDLELHALRALEQREVREFYRRRWKAFLVDEFQDTNPVQAELLAKLTGLPLTRVGMGPDAATPEPALLTVVGDEKQSIYGFRRADLDVFRQVRQAIEAQGGETIELATSFRTHHELMSPLNSTFEPALADLHQALEGARSEGPGVAPYLSVQLVVSEERVLKQFRQRAEAHHLGELIESLIDGGTPVHDRASGDLRPARPGDIAILARTWDTLSPYGDELAARGIPTIHAGGGDLLAQREAKDAMALLRFLADPSDDLSLAAVLRSPFFALEDRRLVELAAEARAGGSSWWAALAQHLPQRERDAEDNARGHTKRQRGAEENAEGATKRELDTEDDARVTTRRERDAWANRVHEPRRDPDPFALRARDEEPAATAPGRVRAAASILQRLLTARREEAPTRLLGLADDLTGYSAVIANLPGGQRRLADWRGFNDFVAQLERGQEDVFSTVRELRQLTSLTDLKVPRPGMEASDAVSLMSVHNAKGLEWPIVIVPDMTASTSGNGGGTLFEADAGVAFKVRDEAGETVEPALFTILDARRKAREAEEELRVLYVALTRARDRVVLSGSQEKGGRLESLSEGLAAAGVEPLCIPFEPAHAVPKTPRPEAAARQGERLLGDVGPGLFELPVTSLSTYAGCPKRFRFEQLLQHPGATGDGEAAGSGARSGRSTGVDDGNSGEVAVGGDRSTGAGDGNGGEVVAGAGSDRLTRVDDGNGGEFVVGSGRLNGVGGWGEPGSGSEEPNSTATDRDGAAPGSGVAARIGDLTHRALQFGIADEAHLATLDPDLDAAEVERALSYAQVFRHSPLFAHLRERIVRRELPLLIDASEYGSSLRLHGVADAVGEGFVLDYKTGARDREAHLLQVAVYAGALGVERAYVAYLAEEALVEFSAAELQAARDRVAELLAGIERGDLAATPSVLRCRHCPFEPICEESALRQPAAKEVETTTR